MPRAFVMASGVNSETIHPSVITGLVPVIHVLFLFQEAKTWMAGHRRAEATPSLGRLCPAMTEVA
jgi:hypothetical protein